MAVDESSMMPSSLPVVTILRPSQPKNVKLSLVAIGLRIVLSRTDVLVLQLAVIVGGYSDMASF